MQHYHDPIQAVDDGKSQPPSPVLILSIPSPRKHIIIRRFTELLVLIGSTSPSSKIKTKDQQQPDEAT